MRTYPWLIIFLVALSFSCGKSVSKGDQGDPGAPGSTLVGKAGDDGKDGVNGKDGQDGVKGKDGKDGADSRTLVLRNLTIGTERPDHPLTNLSQKLLCSAEVHSSDGTLPTAPRLVAQVLADGKALVHNIPAIPGENGRSTIEWAWNAALMKGAQQIQCEFQLLGSETLITSETSPSLAYLNESTEAYNFSHMSIKIEKGERNPWSLVLTAKDGEWRQPARCDISIRTADARFSPKKAPAIVLGKEAARIDLPPNWTSSPNYLMRVDSSCRPGDAPSAAAQSLSLWFKLVDGTAEVSYALASDLHPDLLFMRDMINEETSLGQLNLIPEWGNVHVSQWVERILTGDSPDLDDLRSIRELGPAFISRNDFHQLVRLVKKDGETCALSLSILDSRPDSWFGMGATDDLRVALNWAFEHAKEESCQTRALFLGILNNEVPAAKAAEAQTLLEQRITYLSLDAWPRLCKAEGIWHDIFMNKGTIEALICRYFKTDSGKVTQADYAQVADRLMFYGEDWESSRARLQDPGAAILNDYLNQNLDSYSRNYDPTDLKALKAQLETDATGSDQAAEKRFENQMYIMDFALQGASPTLQAWILERVKARASGFRKYGYVLLATGSVHPDFASYFSSLRADVRPSAQFQGMLGQLALSPDPKLFDAIVNFWSIYANQSLSLDLTLSSMLPYLGEYKTALADKLLIPGANHSYCRADDLKNLAKAGIHSELTLDFIEIQLKSVDDCAEALDAAVAMGYEAWRPRTDRLLTFIQNADRQSSFAWVRLAALLFKLGKHTEVLESMILKDLQQIRQNPYQVKLKFNLYKNVYEIAESAASPEFKDTYPVFQLLHSLGNRGRFASNELTAMMDNPNLPARMLQSACWISHRIWFGSNRNDFKSLNQSLDPETRTAAFLSLL